MARFHQHPGQVSSSTRSGPHYLVRLCAYGPTQPPHIFAHLLFLFLSTFGPHTAVPQTLFDMGVGQNDPETYSTGDSGVYGSTGVHSLNSFQVNVPTFVVPLVSNALNQFSVTRSPPQIDPAIRMLWRCPAVLSKRTDTDSPWLVWGF